MFKQFLKKFPSNFWWNFKRIAKNISQNISEKKTFKKFAEWVFAEVEEKIPKVLFEDVSKRVA